MRVSWGSLRRGVEITSKPSIAEATRSLFPLRQSQAEKLNELRKVSALNLSWFFFVCFYQKQWKLLRQWNKHLKVALLKCQNSKLDRKGDISATSATPSKGWAKLPLLQIPFSLTDLTAHSLLWHVFLALRSNSFVYRAFNGFSFCSFFWLDDQLRAADHVGLQSVTETCETCFYLKLLHAMLSYKI